MTSEERLKIAEELLSKFPRNIYVDIGDGVTIGRIEMQSGPKWRGYRDGSDFWLSEDPIDVVYKARQKLAAEREAAMTPNERKYKAALEEIARDCGHRELDVYCLKASNTAREALKETP